MRGLLGAGIVPGLLREAYAGGKTGPLRFARSGQRCSLRFVNGHIVRADASSKELRLGEVMVARGLLDQSALDRGTEAVLRERKPLGQVLKEQGAIGQEQLEDALVLHVCEVLAHVFSWKEGSWDYEEQVPETFMEETDYPLKMSTADMILEAVALVGDQGAVRFGLGDFDRVLLPSSDARLRFQRMALAPIDGFVLSRVDGTLSIGDVIEVTPLPPEAVERSIFALLCIGLLDYVCRPPKKAQPVAASSQVTRQEILDAHAALGTRNHFEILGVAPSATDAEVKAAYFRLAKRLHPDIHHDPALADLREHLGLIFSRLSSAYEVLSNRQARAAYQAQLEQGGQGSDTAAASAEPPRADEMFVRAKERFDDGKYWEAVALLEETVRFAEGGLRQRARVLLARAYLKNPDNVRHAEKELRAAIHEDPAHPDAYFLLGTLYKRAGMNARAKAMLEKVLELNPQHRKALAELDTLGPGS